MRAVVFETCGPPSVLKLKDDVPVPKVTPDRVLVKIHGAGTYPETKLRAMCVSLAPMACVLGADFLALIDTHHDN